MSKLPHIRSISIENFKRFDKLSVENIGTFNLIVGDNNVGKSSLLEALVISDDYKQFLDFLIYILYKNRNFANLKDSFIYQYFNKIEDNSGVMLFSLKKVKDDGPPQYDYKLSFKDKYTFKWETNIGNFNKILEDKDARSLEEAIAKSQVTETISLPSNYLAFSVIPFLPFQLGYSHELADYYSTNIQQNKSKKKQLIEDLKSLIPKIDNIEPSPAFVQGQSVIIIGQEGMDSNMPLGTFGDGAIKLFRILIEMQVHTGSRLMIDEIDTGIHYSRMKVFWKTLIRSARMNEVQLFATTHNSECIKYYKEALEEENDTTQNEGRIIRLVEMKDSSVKAYTYTFEEFTHSIENENELR